METCELQKRNGHRAARSVPVAGKPAGLSAGILALLPYAGSWRFLLRLRQPGDWK